MMTQCQNTGTIMSAIVISKQDLANMSSHINTRTDRLLVTATQTGATNADRSPQMGFGGSFPCHPAAFCTMVTVIKTNQLIS